MNAPESLEDRLRVYFNATASQLRLPPLELDDLLAHPEATNVVRMVATGQRRGATWLVAAALVGGAVLGAGAILVVRNEDSTTPSVVPPATFDAPAPAAAGMCPDEPLPRDLADLRLPNDMRIPGVLLPAETPSGYCVADHQIAMNPGGPRYTVWASCRACNGPTASITRIELTAYPGWESDLPYDDVDVEGRSGRFYEPNSDVAISRLYVETGNGPPLMFAGWGLDKEEFSRFAASAIDQPETDDIGATADDIGAMALVFDGGLGEYLPGNIPLAATLSVWYFDEGRTGLGYRVYQSPTSDPSYMPPLEAYAWAQPNPVYADVDGHHTVTFPAAAWFADQQQSAVITEIDDRTLVLWSSTGNPPVPGAELAAIELTPAEPDDPRWLEIAYESGQYDAVG